MAVTAVVSIQFRVSVPVPPLIASKEVKVRAGALNVSLLAVPTGASTPVVSVQLVRCKSLIYNSVIICISINDEITT